MWQPPADFPEPGSEAWYRLRDEKQREQERLHALDPQHVPFYLPADDPDFPDESYTAGGPEEDF